MWLGLERIHQMTAAQHYELLVELKDFEGNYKYARYDAFAIDSEAEQYRLRTLGAYTGTAGDSLSAHKGMKFSTMDRDNDNIADYSCAEHWDGGWWFDKCFKAFLNGRYPSADEHKISWYTFHVEAPANRPSLCIYPAKGIV
uniref:Fibrinogen C-terminal domain-containing protein n=1 Tax=Anopheles albimanus TaxID=7167 RepID=A0A182F2L2_ANOAL